MDAAGARRLSVRMATATDVSAITEITNALLQATTYEWRETPYGAGDREKWFADQRARGNPVLVATAGDAVVGWASYGDFRNATRWPGYRFTAEHTIHVSESHWGRGVGRMLMTELIDCARRARKRVLVAAIDATNVRSIGFHAALGFSEVARMPGIGEKWGRRLDLVLMQVDLVNRRDDRDRLGPRGVPSLDPDPQGL